jgi:hypothetical protein
MESDDTTPTPVADVKRAKSMASEVIVQVDSVDSLRRAFHKHQEHVACVICPFGTSIEFEQAVRAASATTDAMQGPAFNLFDDSVPQRRQQFMSSNHAVRLVQQVVAGCPPHWQCPFIVYANPQKSLVAESWRQECAMRCGAFGFACRTDRLFELIKRVTDVYMLHEQQPLL